jgi:putative hydrolase of the HAD superfamily
MSLSSDNLSSQTLLIDADDTLWENNIYFERAIAQFISFLDHQEHSPEQVRGVLNDVERDCIVRHGYGLHSFSHALVDTFERLAVEPITPAVHETIRGFSNIIAEHPIELLDDVTETLEYLARRHRLILMTKGAVPEQSGKVERSGLARFFEAVEIVPEKETDTYRSLAAKYDLMPQTTWMIGNSPRSDINPSLEADLNAVFVPHDSTWILENEEVNQPRSNRQLLVLDKFSTLRSHF